jgi:hypothetical protein
MSTIDGISISWVRTRAVPAQIIQLQVGDGLTSRQRYLTHFATAGQWEAWRQPWIGDESFSYFWSRSFGPNYRMTAADKAWRRQVPLREAVPPVLTTAQRGVTLTADRFVFPSGVGVVIRADLTGQLTPEGALEIVAALANSQVVNAAGFPAPRAIAAVFGDLLDGAEQISVEGGDPNAVENNQPMTIATITATSDWPVGPVAAGDGNHRLLEGLCRLSKAPLTGTIHPLEECLLDEADSHPGTTRYVLGRAVATMSPDQSSTPDGTDRLSCYHSNLTLAALHASVLLDIVQWATTVPFAGLNQSTRESLIATVNILGLLYGKVPDMYTSAFVRKLIADSGLVPAIGQLRIDLGVGGPLK